MRQSHSLGVRVRGRTAQKPSTQPWSKAQRAGEKHNGCCGETDHRSSRPFTVFTNLSCSVFVMFLCLSHTHTHTHPQHKPWNLSNYPWNNLLDWYLNYAMPLLCYLVSLSHTHTHSSCPHSQQLNRVFDREMRRDEVTLLVSLSLRASFRWPFV